MRIALTGSHGLVGSALAPFLATHGHVVLRLVRAPQPVGEATIAWDPATGLTDPTALAGVDAVIHLAGAGIADARWTPARKQQIRDSRVQGTRMLCQSISALSTVPRILLVASAVGYYGDRGEEQLTEQSAPGTGFLAEVCQAWEAATAPASQRGIRVVHLRTGVVLSPRGGALAKMLPPFRLGLGGPLGHGRQYMSWIAMDDVLGAMQHVLMTDRLHGPVHLTAPHPVTNRVFTRTLGRVLHRTTVCPVPAFLLRLLVGQLADAALLSSARAAPSQLLATGYTFRFATLEPALQHLLRRTE